MNFIKEEGRIYVEDDTNKVIAQVSFSKVDKNTYNINHTFVDPSLRGQGIASKLVEEAVKYIESKGCNIIASCSYAESWLKKNRS